MMPPPGPVSPTLYTTSVPATVEVDEASLVVDDTSLLEDDDPPPQETNTRTTPANTHLVDRICSPFVSSKQNANAIGNRSI